MKAVILAAGLGERLKPLTDEIPKVMVPIAGKPLLEWQIAYLKQYAISDIYINLHDKPEKIRDFAGDGKKFNVHITYSYEPKLRGTAGALIGFKKYLRLDFLLLYGDIFTQLNISHVQAYHRSKKAFITAVVQKTDHPDDSDLVRVSKQGSIEGLLLKPHVQKPVGSTSLGAMYICNTQIFELIPTGRPSDVTHDVLPLVLQSEKPLYAFQTVDFMMDIGTPDRLARANSYVVSQA